MKSHVLHILCFHISGEATVEIWNRSLLGVKPWPNGTLNSSQLEPSSQLRWSWVSFGHPLGLSWLELDRAGWNLIKLKFSPNSSQVFHRLATTVYSSQLSPSCFELLCDYAVIFRQVNGFLQAGSTWQYRLATHRCKFWFCNLAQVGLSWEYRLARALTLSLLRVMKFKLLLHPHQ